MTNYAPVRRGVVIPLKICVGVTSCLSIIGGFLIVLTFCWRVCSSKRPRPHGGTGGAPQQSRQQFGDTMLSPGRLIIVNLSIADILVAGSHLWGVIAGYQTFFERNDNADVSGPNGSTDAQCKAQGAVAVYGTIASFLWTITLSFFVVATLLLPRPRLYGSPCALLTYLLGCWGLPAAVLVVLAVMKAFGLDDESSIAWCYTLPRTQKDNYFITFFAYNIWCYLTITLLMIFFLVTLCYTSLRAKRGQGAAVGGGGGRGGGAGDGERARLVNEPPVAAVAPTNQPSQERKLDSSKLIFAALILVILRIWDAIYVSLGYHPHYDKDVEDSSWILILIFLAGIGNSAQGFANAILFLLCTKTYRRWIVEKFNSCCTRQTDNELASNN